MMIQSDKLIEIMIGHVRARCTAATSKAEESSEAYDLGRVDAFEETLRLLTTMQALVTERSGEPP